MMMLVANRERKQVDPSTVLLLDHSVLMHALASLVEWWKTTAVAVKPSL